MYVVDANRLTRRAGRRAKGWAVALATVLCAGSAQAQDNRPIDVPLLVTYGKDAPSREGDPTNRQVIYLSLPAETNERVYVRLFDPETGGDHDLVYGKADTVTRFALFGGTGAYAGDMATGGAETPEELTGGTLLQERNYGTDEGADGQWIPFALLSPEQGDLVGDRRVFRLLVEGTSGNDGNLYGVALSLRERRAVEPAGTRLFSFAPTIRVPNRQTLTELRFTAPADQRRLEVQNFDAAHGRVALTTRFRTLPLTASGQDQWKHDTVELEERELGETAAITLAGGGEIPNDATFFISVKADRLLPLDLPPFNWIANRRPTVEVDTTFLDSCRAVAFDASRSGDPDGNRLSFTWRFSDGTTAEGPSVVKDYPEPGRFTERLEVTDDSNQVGNGSAADINVLVKHPPVPRIDVPATVAAGETVTFEAAASDAGPWRITGYDWVFNDGSTATGRTVTRVFEAPGDYRVVLRIRDDSGHACDTAALEIAVRANARPVAEAGPDRRTEAGTRLRFDGSRSYDQDGRITAYDWDMGDGTLLSGAAVEHGYAGPGRYTVRLTVTDDAGVANSTASDTAEVIVNETPYPVAGLDLSVAIGEVIRFDGSASSDADGTLIDHAWDFGDGSTASGAVASYAYGAPGTYSVRLTVTDDSGTATRSASDTLSVRVNAPPVAVAGPDQMVTASVVQFDGFSSSDPDDAVADYHWEFGDGETGSGPAPAHVYRRPGTYRVRLTVTDASGTIRNTAEDSLTVIVNAPPIADAGPDLIGAPGEDLTFQATRSVDPDGDVVAYDWDFKDGTTASGPVVVHAFDKPGTYHVRLTVRDDTGHDNAVDHDEAQVTINAEPVAEAGPDVLIAPGETARLDGSRSHDPDGTVTDYRWDFSDSDEPVFGAVAERRFDTPGVYTARLTISDDAGVDNSLAEDEVTIRVNHQPVAEAGADQFTARTFVVFDGSGSLDPDGDALTYNWDFGDGTRAQGAVVAHTYAASGRYPVMLTVDDGTGLANATHRDAMTVTINSAPVAVAGENQRLCTGDVLVLDGSNSYDPDGGVLKYAWDFGDGESSDIVNPTKTYRRGGVYPVALTVTDDSGLGNASHTDRIAVTVDQAPVAEAGEDMKICANTEVTFDGSKSWDEDGVVNRFLWDFGDGGSGGGERPKHLYRRAGTYRVHLTIEGDQVGQCDIRSTDEVTVEVVAAPVPLIVAPQAVPAGAEVVLDGSTSYLDGGAITAWRWDLGDGTAADGETARHVFDTPGTYRIALTVNSTAQSDDCRQITAYHVLTVNAPPVAEAGADLIVGVNEEFVLDASASRDPDGGIAAYRWDLGDGRSAEGAVTRQRYATPGRYTVTLTVEDTARLANSVATDTLTVIVHDGVAAVLDAPAAACVGEQVTLSAARSTSPEGPIRSYAWSLGDGTTSDAPSLTKRFVSPGRYNLSVLLDDGMGRASSRREASHILHVNRPPNAVAGADRIVCPGVPVMFDAAASSDPDGTITAVTWSFGDGATASGPRAEHIFDKPGTYEVEVAVTDDSGSSCATQTDRLTVIVNAPPSADAGGDKEVFVGGANDQVAFSGWRSYDPDGTDLAHVWDFGPDGQRTGERVSHMFSGPGDYQVTLTVSDMTGLSCGVASDTIAVKVRAREGF
ncbi:PKD domain-containing protein [Polymorphum gilvum]|uniref:PKD domain protein n=1 Tax=Polymorphum gilvum (strain LMG 25793 / CGMCC 1.9160 / SL003B-26A1) TaxID=991905 RepID=F2J1S5_POLGS|nr:PKD domain-containing protein [Polymorphum gilvum]ADZ71986.1 PKD domain protein [Polymorphum gilvum SL003B-26A1]